MAKILLLLALFVTLVAACSESNKTASVAKTEPATVKTSDAPRAKTTPNKTEPELVSRQPDAAQRSVLHLADEIMSRTEGDAEEIELQLIQIPFAGCPGFTGKRTQEQALQELGASYQRIVSGTTFREEQSRHSGKGKSLTLIKSQSATTDVESRRLRRDAMPRIGEVAWRLQPGEVGVVLYDYQASPHGYYLIHRIR